MNAVLFILACAVIGTLIGLTVTALALWWIERTDPRRWERVH